MWLIVYHQELKNDVAQLPKNIRLRIQKAIEERLLVDPISFGEPLRRVLKGYRKFRVGDYRLIYRLDKKTIIVLFLAHRKHVYDQFLKSSRR